jgi:hypothetical protein
VTRGEGLRRVEQEIRQAKAEALGRVGERLEAVLAELAALDRHLDRRLATPPAAPADRADLVAEVEARNRVRDEARRLVHQLIVQREAVGFRRHALVAERYPVPPRRTMGPSDPAVT